MFRKIILLLFFLSASNSLLAGNLFSSYNFNLNYSDFYDTQNYSLDFAFGWEYSIFYKLQHFQRLSIGKISNCDKFSWEYSFIDVSHPSNIYERNLISDVQYGECFRCETRTCFLKYFLNCQLFKFSENKPFDMYHNWASLGIGLLFAKRTCHLGCFSVSESNTEGLKFISMLSFKYGLSTLRPGSHLFRDIGSDANHTYFGHDIKSEFDIGLLYDSKISLSAVSSYHSIISDRLFRHCNLGLKFKWVFHTYKNSHNEDSDALQLYCAASRSFVFIEKNELISNNIDLGIKVFALFWRK